METTLTRQNKLGSISDFASGKFEDKKFIFHLCSNGSQGDTYTDKKGKMTVKHTNTSENLPMVSQVFVPGKGMRVARYIPGHPSIWKDEQTNVDEKDYVEQYLQFIDGRRHVDGTDKQLLEFMMNVDWNESKPGRDPKAVKKFRMLDLGAGLEKEIEKEIEVYDVILWCLKADYDQVSSYARVLGISLGNDPAQVRSEMKRKAMANPALFKQGMGNKLTLRKHYVLEAIDAGVLKIDKNLNQLIWDNDRLVIAAPRGVDLIDFFVDFTITENGEATYENLLSKIGKGNAPIKKQEAELPSTGLQVDEASELFHAGVAANIFTKKGTSVWVFEEGGINERKFVGSAKLIDALRSDAEFLKNVKLKMNL